MAEAYQYEKWTTGLFPLHSQPPSRQPSTIAVKLHPARARLNPRPAFSPYVLVRLYRQI